MNIRSLRKWYRKIIGEDGKLFRYSAQEQEKYMSLLGEPADDVERSFFQYKCQMHMISYLGRFILALGGMCILLKAFLSKKADVIDREKNNKAVLMYAGSQNDVPSTIFSEFSVIQDKIFLERKKITKQDVAFAKEVWKRHPFALGFIGKLLTKIYVYRYEIDNHSPAAVLVSEEFSYTSSALNEFCRRNGVLHINFMHGDKLFYMRDSFFHFDRCYIWNDYYRELFVKLRAEDGQFIVELPPSFKISSGITEKKYDFTYYLGQEKADELERIKNTIDVLTQRGFSACVRPHPRYSDMNVLNKIFRSEEIQDTSSTPIEVSIMQTRNSVSLLSSVLLQSFFNGVGIVIDDVTDKSKYQQVEALGFICCRMEHRLLSNVIRERENDKTRL